jgi:hypothetical protein
LCFSRIYSILSQLYLEEEEEKEKGREEVPFANTLNLAG